MLNIDQVACAEDPLTRADPLSARLDPAGEESQSHWRRSFPGEACQVSEVRRWLRSLLPGCPATDDVVCVASELAANAVQHTQTGQGGWFRVEVAVRGRDAIRVAVADNGGPGTPRIAAARHSERGRGLRVVRALSACDGYSGDAEGRQVWAEIPWQGI